jgi:hypothetical protein
VAVLRVTGLTYSERISEGKVVVQTCAHFAGVLIFGINDEGKRERERRTRGAKAEERQGERGRPSARHSASGAEA